MTGSGTLADPYIIWDVNDLQDVGNGAPYGLGDYYELGANIDASATSGWDGGAGFMPIGTSAAEFTGHFDGNYYTISDLYISRSDPKGIFGYCDGATIQNVKVVGLYVYGHGTHYTGGLSGQAERTTFYRCYVEGEVRANAAVNAGNVGMLVGWLDGGTISQCWSKGVAYGYNYIGGLLGTGSSARTTTIINSYSRADVTATGQGAGGVAGIPADYHTHLYGAGPVTGSGRGGVTRIYAPDGMVGDTANFWDTQTTGCSGSGRNNAAGHTVGKTTAQMKTKSTFTDAGWDFVAIWDIDGYWNDGYPFLRWEGGPPLIHVTVPNGGEIWDAGSTYTILWTHLTSLDPNTHVSIELLKGGVLDETISASTPIGPPGGGNYNWTIDPKKTPGPDYRVRVTGNTHPYSDTSDDDFKIRDPTVVTSKAQVATLPATGVG